jgi:glycosyltransferase 2 family protein
LRKYLKFLVLAAAALVVLYLFFRGLNWAEVRHSVAQADGLLILIAIALVCLTYVIRSFRWKSLLSPIVHTNFWDLFAATTLGFSALFIIGRAGEIVRPAYLPLRDRNVKAASSFVTIFIERIYDMTAIVVLFSLNLIWFKAPGQNLSQYAQVRRAGFLLLGIACAGIVGLFIFRLYSRPVISAADRVLQTRFVPSFVRRFITNILTQLSQALGVLVDLRELMVTVAWTVVLWLTIALADLLILRAFGLPFGFVETIFIMGWALLGSLAPTPGGAAGAFHWSTAFGLMFLGVQRDTAAAVAIITHLVVFGPAIIFGAYYFFRSGLEIDKIRSLSSSNKMEAVAEQ